MELADGGTLFLDEVGEIAELNPNCCVSADVSSSDRQQSDIR